MSCEFSVELAVGLSRIYSTVFVPNKVIFVLTSVSIYRLYFGNFVVADSLFCAYCRAVTNFSSRRGIVKSSQGTKKSGATAAGCCRAGEGGGGVVVRWRLRV